MSEGKAAIVTAAGKGMGAACARALHARGYGVALMSPSGSASKLAAELGGVGVDGSVTEPGDLERLVSACVDRYGRVDVAVCNTGHPPKGALLEIGDAEWHAGLDMALLSVVRTARLVVPHMKKRGGGSIVNISTFAAREPAAKFPVSATIRAGLSAFTKLFADEHAKDRIRMNCVLPGFVETFPADDETRGRIPMRRPAKVEEIANTVAFLAGGESSYITGQSITVDGGLNRSF